MDTILDLLTGNLWLVLTFCVAALGLVHHSKQEQNKKWTKYNIKRVQGSRWPIVGPLYEVIFGDRLKLELARRNKYGKLYGNSMHGKERVFVADAEVIRQIAIKDFDVFPNHQRSMFGNKYQREFLVWLQDNHWKRVRSMMTPTFTSGKIRNMFRFLQECSEDLVLYFKEKLKQSPDHGGSNLETDGRVLDLVDSFGMYTMDGISTCCYGLKLPRASILGEGKSGATRDDLVAAIRKCEGLPALRIACLVLVPKFLLKWVGFKMNSEANFQPLIRRVEKLIEIRRRAVAGGKKHDDLLQLLVDARLGDKVVSSETDNYENHHAGLDENTLANDQSKLMESINAADRQPNSAGLSLSDHEILSEAAFMLLAGYETTRVLLTNCAYVLSHKQSIQEQLYQELRRLAHFNQEKQCYEFEYDQLTSCAYLDAVISETLRYLPPAMHTDRVASRDYRIEKYNAQLAEGESLMFCIYAVHHDTDYWEQPEEFRPDRFMPGQREKIVPGSYIPFSLGPRHCIGMRFSLTEAKLGLAKVLLNFKLLPAPEAVWPPKAKPISPLLLVKNARALVVARPPANQVDQK